MKIEQMSEKIVVTSPMRTGSTVVLNSIQRALEQPDYIPGPKEEDLLEDFKGILKTHCLHDGNLGRFQAKHPDAKVVVCLRQWKDLLISRLLYCKQIAGKNEGRKEIRDRILEHPDATPSEFVSMMLDEEKDTIVALLKEAKRFWRLALLGNPNVSVAIYENFIFDPENFFCTLFEEMEIEVSPERLAIVLAGASPYTSKKVMNKHFASRMTAGHWYEWLTEEQVSWLEETWVQV